MFKKNFRIIALMLCIVLMMGCFVVNTEAVSTVLLAVQGAIVDGNLVKFSGINGIGVDTGVSATNVVKCKFDATAAPTGNDDVSEGYTVGSRWLDTTNDKSYVCLDNTDGAAVWHLDVVGPGSSTDRAIVRWDSTTGRTVLNSVVTVSDAGVVAGGEWQGTVISPVYGGTGIANDVASTWTISGNFATTITVTNVTAITLPTAGTLCVTTGTPETTFQIDDDNLGPMLKNSAGEMQIKNAADDAFADLRALSFYGDGSNLTGVGVAAASALTISAKAAENIAKGLVVYISGATGQTPEVSIADNTDAAKHLFLGIAAEAKTTGQTILIRVRGELINIDTSTFSDGNLLYLTTGGGLTATAPTSGAVEPIGYCSYSHVSAGKIVVMHHSPHSIYVPSGDDIVIRMGDALAANKIYFKDYANAEVGFIDSDGKADFTSLTLDNPLIPAEGGTGVSNASNNTITFTGNYTLGLTLSGNTSITLPTSGTVLTNAANTIDSDQYVDGSIDHEHLAADVISGMTDVTSEDADYILIWDNTDSSLKKVDMGEIRGAAGSFVGLSDTPADYTGAANKFLQVNATPDAIIFDTISVTDVSGAAASGANIDITSILNVALYVGRDADNKIDWGTDDTLKITIAGVLHSIVSITDGAGDNDKLVTQGYVDDQVAGANVNLSNLAAVAINTSLLSDTADTDDLGSATKEWRSIYVGTVGGIYLGLSQEISLEVTDANTLYITASANVSLSGGLIVAGTVALAANNITMTGSIGVTGSRVTKLWTADLECTNDITIGGTALAAIYEGIITGTDTHVMFFDGADTPGGEAGFTYIKGTDTLNVVNIACTAISGTLTGTASVAATGDAAVDFFGAGVDAVTDATECTDIEGTGLAIAGGVLNMTVPAEHIDSDMYADGSIDHEHLAPDVISGLDADTLADADAFIFHDETGSDLNKITWTNLMGSITKVGTIGTGTWEGTDVGLAHGGTGVSTGAMVNFTSILNVVLYIGRDADNQIKFADDNTIVFRLGGVDGVSFISTGELDMGAHSAGFTLQTATGDGTTTIDWRLGNKFQFTHGDMAETFTFTAPSNPGSLTLEILEDANGAHDCNWPAPVTWLGIEPTWTDGGADKTIVVVFWYNGTTYWGQGTPWES